MNLKEYEGKAVFSEGGIAVPRGRVVRTAEEAWQAMQDLGVEEAVIKAQVLTGKRGKVGGIQVVTEDIVQKQVKELLKKKIHGFSVREILVEEKLLIEEELYVAITVDRGNKCMSVICSTEGGMDIETVASDTPEKIHKTPLTERALSLDDAVSIASKLSGDAQVRKQIADVLIALYHVVEYSDACLVEINPLVVTVQREVIAADSKVVIDENALFRQEHFRQEIEDMEDHTELEREALKDNYAYVELDGDIGVIGNGAGLTMTMIDLIHHFGGSPANFMDIGGAARIAEMEQALGIVLKKKGIKALCVNIFGGITHCDEIARGIMNFKKEHNVTVPLVVRMVGTNVKKATQMLEKEGITVINSLEEAVRHSVEVTGNQ